MNNNQISQLREIPLETVLAVFKAQPDPKDPMRNYRTSAGRITITGQQFYNHDLKEGGGGAIDLTVHLGGFKFPQAIAFLAKEVGVDAAITQYQVESVKHAKKIIDETPPPKQEIPLPDASKLSRVRAYLTDVRCIPDDLIDKTIATGRLWADKYGNAVFALHDPCLSGKLVGAELRGTYEKPFHGVRGEQKGMFFTGSAKTYKAVFVESAIDALSYEAMYPKSALVISTTGSAVDNLLQTATGLREKGYNLVAGFDNDKDGNRFAQTLEALGNVAREKPAVEKDWNKQLQVKVKIDRDAQQNVVKKSRAERIEQSR